jgi:ABC-type uncharacterized transport system involved in gliding motility auxiliary subunit
MNKLMQKLDVVGLVFLIAAAVRYAAYSRWDVWAWVLTILGVACAAAGLAANYRKIAETLGRRSSLYALIYVISVLLVFGLVGGLNFLAQRHSKRFDLTASGQFTLSPQSVQVTAKLDKDLNIKAFYPGGENPPLQELLSQYRDVNKHVRFEFIDPDRRPEQANQYGVKQYSFGPVEVRYGTIVMLYGDRSDRLELRQRPATEEDLTRLIIKLQRTKIKKAYFLQGNGEKDPASDEGDGCSFLRRILEYEGFLVDSLNLAGLTTIPADANLLIEAGPTIELNPDQVQLLKDFTMNRGGAMMIMVDPPPAASMASFLADWGVVPENDLVISSGAYSSNKAWPVVRRSEYQSHPITSNFELNTLFPRARSVQAAKTVPTGVNVSVLFKTMDFPDSYGKADVKAEDLPFNEKTDIKGPLSLAVAVTKEIKPATDKAAAVTARLIVVGDSGFIENRFMQQTANPNLALNMADWLAQQEDLIAMRPKSPEDRKIFMTDGEQNLLAILILVLLPGAVVAAGIVVMKKRRK